jgi:hypothetical protein
MNNTNVVSMDYRFFIEAGELLIEAHWSQKLLNAPKDCSLHDR